MRDIISQQNLYRVRAVSQQYQELGDEQYNYLFEDEELNMERVWLCLDFYMFSITSNRCPIDGNSILCHENYAKSASKVGKLYSNALKLSDKAHTWYLRTIQHAEIVKDTSGAVFFSKEWYQIARQGIEKYRKEKEAFDAKEVEKVREPTLIKLKPVLDKIKEQIGKSESKQYQSHLLLLHIYGVNPPKKGSLIDNLDRDDKEQMKKAVLKAVTHYHPDKNKEHGMEWLILCEEITKLLNGFYEHYK